MGNVVSHVMRHHRGSTLARREIEDVLNRLSVLAEVKARNHHSRVTSHPIDAEVLPIEKVVRKVHLAHCGVSSGNVKAVQDAIEEHFGYYMVGDVVCMIFIFLFFSFIFSFGGIFCEGVGGEGGCLFPLYIRTGVGELTYVCIYTIFFEEKGKKKDEKESMNEQITHPHSLLPPAKSRSKDYPPSSPKPSTIS